MGINLGTDEETMEDLDSHADKHKLVDRYKHYKRRHAHYKNLYLAGEKYKPIAGLLSAALIMLVLVIVFNKAFVKSGLESDVENLKRQNYELNRSLESSESRVSKMLRQLGELQDRHPELSVLSFDSLIPLDTNYARSILLRKSEYGNAITFLLLLENTGTDRLEPAVYIELFNDSGESISSIKLALAGNSQVPPILEPGAVKSVSGEFDLPAAAVYFKLRAE